MSQTPATLNEKGIEFILNNFNSAWRFRLMLLGSVPMNFFAGIRIKSLTREKCEATVPYKWLNKNPFRSTFWAVLGMTAELASGAMLVMYTHKLSPSIAMLVTSSNAKFLKKATQKTTFVCTQGKEIESAVKRAIETREPQVITCKSIGYNPEGEVVAEFEFSWSIKARG